MSSSNVLSSARGSEEGLARLASHLRRNLRRLVGEDPRPSAVERERAFVERLRSASLRWQPAGEERGNRARPSHVGRPSRELFVLQPVLEAVRADLAAREDACGFLLGRLLPGGGSGGDPAGEDPGIVLIEEMRRSAAPAPAVPEQVDAFREAWREAIEDATGRRRELLGWYHGHRLFGPEMTGHDRDVHLEFFPEPWHCALVLVQRPLHPEGAFIVRPEGQLYFQRSLVGFREVFVAGRGEGRNGPAPPNGGDATDAKLTSTVDWQNYRSEPEELPTPIPARELGLPEGGATTRGGDPLDGGDSFARPAPIRGDVGAGEKAAVEAEGTRWAAEGPEPPDDPGAAASEVSPPGPESVEPAEPLGPVLPSTGVDPAPSPSAATGTARLERAELPTPSPPEDTSDELLALLQQRLARSERRGWSDGVDGPLEAGSSPAGSAPSPSRRSAPPDSAPSPSASASSASASSASASSASASSASASPGSTERVPPEDPARAWEALAASRPDSWMAKLQRERAPVTESSSPRGDAAPLLLAPPDPAEMRRRRLLVALGIAIAAALLILLLIVA